MCEIESFYDALIGLNSLDMSTLHSKKKAEIRDAINDIQTQINELLNKLN